MGCKGAFAFCLLSCSPTLSASAGYFAYLSGRSHGGFPAVGSNYALTANHKMYGVQNLHHKEGFTLGCVAFVAGYLLAFLQIV